MHSCWRVMLGTSHDDRLLAGQKSTGCTTTDLPLVLKGVLSGDLGRLAVDHGIAGVIVSNHHGLSFNDFPAALTCSPEVAAAVAGRAEVYMEGGIRRGDDIVKAAALGATAVLVGHAASWGLVSDGEVGVGKVLEILRRQTAHALECCGLDDIRMVHPNSCSGLRERRTSHLDK